MAGRRIPLIAVLLSTAAALGLAGCDGDGVGLGLFSRRQAPPTALGSAQQRRDPALSGDGRLLASIVESNGRSMVLLQEQPSSGSAMRISCYCLRCMLNVECSCCGASAAAGAAVLL